jgi:hypothetical protein
MGADSSKPLKNIEFNSNVFKSDENRDVFIKTINSTEELTDEQKKKIIAYIMSPSDYFSSFKVNHLGGGSGSVEMGIYINQYPDSDNDMIITDKGNQILNKNATFKDMLDAINLYATNNDLLLPGTKHPGLAIPLKNGTNKIINDNYIKSGMITQTININDKIIDNIRSTEDSKIIDSGIFSNTEYIFGTHIKNTIGYLRTDSFVKPQSGGGSLYTNQYLKYKRRYNKSKN